MTRITLGITAFWVVLLAFVTVFIYRWQEFQRGNQQLVSILQAEARPTGVSADGYPDLPSPVQRYLARVLPQDLAAGGLAASKVVQLEQTGTFWLNNRWQPFTASQVNSLSPLGFVWQARVQAGPGLKAHVVDYYVHAEGGLEARLAGVLTLVNSRGTPMINSSELMRVLAEAPWYPIVFTSEQFSWQPEDAHSATVTVRDGDNEVSLTYHFNEAYEIEAISGLRYRETPEGAVLTPWRGRFWNYAERAGVRLPLDGEVAWLLPEGEQTYWRGHIEQIRYSQ